MLLEILVALFLMPEKIFYNFRLIDTILEFNIFVKIKANSHW